MANRLDPVQAMLENTEQDAPVQFLERMIPEWLPKAPETLNRACLQAQQLGLTKGRRSTTSFHLLLPSLLRVAVYPTGGREHRPSVGNHVLRFATDLSDYTA